MRTTLVALLLCVVGAVAVCEWMGWPFLAGPLQNFLTEKLDRQVGLGTAGNTAQAPAGKGFQVRFLGGIRLYAPRLDIAAPSWSKTPYMVAAEDISLRLRYSDLWRAYRGHPVRIEGLQARTLDSYLERLADGRSSWQFGKDPKPPSPDDRAVSLPRFGSLVVNGGRVRWNDIPLKADADIALSMSAATGSSDNTASLLQAKAGGRFRNQPLQITLDSSAILAPGSGAEASRLPVAITLDAVVGRAQISFKGKTADALRLENYEGDFRVKGPSLAAVGDPLGVTLPSTGPFLTSGRLVKEGPVWKVVVNDATVGSSSLKGAFVYDGGRKVPLLSGRLNGSRLLLVDLGPALGTTPVTTADASGTLSSNGKRKEAGKVLPDRPFDLAALRVMDANVLIDIGEVDLNTAFLQPLKPLHTHLVLADGVLTLRDLLARTAQGQLRGKLSLDGREKTALWNTDVQWDGVQLANWVKQTRGEGKPPYVSGRMRGSAVLNGRGRSTAEILASLKGQVRTELSDGTVSHLVVEAAGLDVAQGLGMLVKGDDALPVQCAVADLAVDGGVARPRVMVLDTADSAVWVDGSVSLSSEAMDLRLVVVPKDFSPFALRTPVRVKGSFSKPDVSLEKTPLALKAGGALLLALINPVAAIIPFVDVGNSDEAKRGAAGCIGLQQRSAAALARARK